MKPVILKDVSDLFLHCFLHYHRFSLEQLSLVKSNNHFTIGNENVVQAIRFHYSRFQSLGVTLEIFFNRTIVKTSRQGYTNRCLIKETEFSKFPLFLIQYREVLYYGSPELYSKHPIKMPHDILCRLVQIPFIELTFENCPRDVDMFKVDGKVCFSDHESPGTSKNDKLIGIGANNVYWIPTRDIIKKRYFCTRNPGRCCVYFDQKKDLDDHEAICRVNTKVTSKQVTLCETLTLKNHCNSTVIFIFKYLDKIQIDLTL